MTTKTALGCFLPAALLGALFCNLITAAPSPALERAFTLKFLDVGEGDATLLQSPTGRVGVIDTGNFISGVRVANELETLGVKSLDFIILTHPHLDHIGGVFYVLQLFPAQAVYDNGETRPKKGELSDTLRWYEMLARQRPSYRALKKGDLFGFDEAEIEILWPPAPLPGPDWNANSIVALFKYGKFHALFMGDAAKSSEEQLVAAYGDKLSTIFLKAGHHAASDSGSLSFISAASPKAVVVSVDRDNIRGYPALKTINRYRSVGAVVYRTDLMGDIVVRAFKDGGFAVQCAKGCEAPF